MDDPKTMPMEQRTELKCNIKEKENVRTLGLPREAQMVVRRIRWNNCSSQDIGVKILEDNQH